MEDSVRDDVIQMMRQAGLTRTKYAPAYRRLIEIAVLAEREACAKVCDELVTHTRALGDNDSMLAAISCAIAIRARGQG
jgi:hypothetical protein